MSYEPVRLSKTYSQSVGAKLCSTQASTSMDKPDVMRKDEREVSDVESRYSTEEDVFKNVQSSGRKKRNRKDKRHGKGLNAGSQGLWKTMVTSVAEAIGDAKAPDSTVQKEKFSFSKVFGKAKDIVFTSLSFEEKVRQVLKLLFDELMLFIVQMVSNGDAITKLLGFFYNG